MLARSLGRINYFTEPEAKAFRSQGPVGLQRSPRGDEELRAVRQRRLPHELERDGRPAQGVSSPGVQGGRSGRRSERQGAPAGQVPPDMEALVQAITDRVLEALKGRS